jgi:hypothetical protein
MRARAARKLLESGEAKGELLLAAVAWPSEPWPQRHRRRSTPSALRDNGGQTA